jgi:hypothetical protein
MKKFLSVLICLMMFLSLISCKDRSPSIKAKDNTQLSPTETYAFLIEQGYNFDYNFSSSPNSINYFIANEKMDIWIQKVINKFIGNFYNFKDDSCNDEHGNIDDTSKNTTNDQIKQYQTYLTWLNKLGLKSSQIIDVLDYYQTSLQNATSTGNEDLTAKSKEETSVPIISNDSKSTPKPTPNTSPALISTNKTITPATSQNSALSKAKSYLNSSAFSREKLISQLEHNNFSHEDSIFAVDNCGANWNEQALKQAKSYISSSAFSYQGLISQLEYSKYTSEQALYGANNCGANWNEQAAKMAKSYLSSMSFTRDRLIAQLEFSKFTHEQAVYGTTANGL